MEQQPPPPPPPPPSAEEKREDFFLLLEILVLNLKAQPALIHEPELAFLKDYMLQLGATLPPAPTPAPTSTSTSASTPTPTSIPTSQPTPSATTASPSSLISSAASAALFSLLFHPQGSQTHSAPSSSLSSPFPSSSQHYASSSSISSISSISTTTTTNPMFLSSSLYPASAYGMHSTSLAPDASSPAPASSEAKKKKKKKKGKKAEPSAAVTAAAAAAAAAAATDEANGAHGGSLQGAFADLPPSFTASPPDSPSLPHAYGTSQHAPTFLTSLASQAAASTSRMREALQRMRETHDSIPLPNPSDISLDEPSSEHEDEEGEEGETGGVTGDKRVALSEFWDDVQSMEFFQAPEVFQAIHEIAQSDMEVARRYMRDPHVGPLLAQMLLRARAVLHPDS